MGGGRSCNFFLLVLVTTKHIALEQEWNIITKEIFGIWLVIWFMRTKFGLLLQIEKWFPNIENIVYILSVDFPVQTKLAVINDQNKHKKMNCLAEVLLRYKKVLLGSVFTNIPKHYDWGNNTSKNMSNLVK